MIPQSSSCALLAERHPALSEGIRGLLETTFNTVYVVADALSLKEGAQRLTPALVVMDISLLGDNYSSLLNEVHKLSPASKVIVLSVHDQASVARRAMACGAQSVVLKRSIGTELLTAINAVLCGKEFISPGFDPAEPLN